MLLVWSLLLQPTVGEACENYHKLPLKTRGLYITLHDKGSVLKKLQSWPVQDIKVGNPCWVPTAAGCGSAGLC